MRPRSAKSSFWLRRHASLARSIGERDSSSSISTARRATIVSAFFAEVIFFSVSLIVALIELFPQYLRIKRGFSYVGALRRTTVRLYTPFFGVFAAKQLEFPEPFPIFRQKASYNPLILPKLSETVFKLPTFSILTKYRILSISRRNIVAFVHFSLPVLSYLRTNSTIGVGSGSECGW